MHEYVKDLILLHLLPLLVRRGVEVVVVGEAVGVVGAALAGMVPLQQLSVLLQACLGILEWFLGRDDVSKTDVPVAYQAFPPDEAVAGLLEAANVFMFVNASVYLSCSIHSFAY